MSAPREIARTVKPRRKPAGWLPIMAVDSGQVFLERTGEVQPVTELPTLIRSEPSSILCAHNIPMLVAGLDEVLDHDPSWQYRISPVRRTVFRANPNERQRVQTIDTVVAFCGFRAPPDSKRKGHYHYPLDPILFHRGLVDELVDGDEPRLLKLVSWASDVRAWCQANELKISPTAGGLGAQLLRDPRFYPNARRKVPRATNERARTALPGNYYELLAKPQKSYSGTYLDMASAHHHCASIIHFPHADRLRARGRFHITDETLETALDRQPWIKAGTPQFRRLTEQGFGLLLVHMTCPRIPAERFPLPYMSPGRSLVFVYTNELPAIRELGGIIDGVEAAWVSFERDTGLNALAAWALAETATMGEQRKRWAKPSILSAYGVLAAKPRTMVFGFKRANGGELRYYPAGPTRLAAFTKSTLTEHDLPVANVIHRGMIEAECRLQVLALARELAAHDVPILSIYADAIIVDSRAQLPLIPPPWIVKGTLTRLRYLTATSFVSEEKTRLPGIPRESVEFLRRLEEMDPRRRRT